MDSSGRKLYAVNDDRIQGGLYGYRGIALGGIELTAVDLGFFTIFLIGDFLKKNGGRGKGGGLNK